MRDLTGEQTLESMSQAAWYNQWLLDRFKGYLHGQILEVGCGIGNFTEMLLPFGSVTAIDYSQHYVQKVKKALNKKADVGLGDIEKGQYFFKNHKFDAIICLNVVEHIKDDTRALTNLFKLLKPGGHLILLIPSNPSLYGEIDRSIGHYRRYDKKQLKGKLTQIGFKVRELYRLNLLGGLGWWYSGKVAKDTIVRQDRIRLFNLLGPVFLAAEKVYEPPVGTSVLAIVQKP